MVKCTFCGKDYPPHIGVHIISNNGTINFYCSSKCRKNALKLKRDNKKLKWTEAYRIAKANESRAAAAGEAKKAEKAAEEVSKEKIPEHKKERSMEKKEEKKAKK